MTNDDLKEILKIGLQAVSTCNNQPWRFKFNDGVLDVFMLRTKNFFLKLEGNTWIELGTLLENISVAAGAKGYQTEYQLFERCGLDEQAARVQFIPCQPTGVDLAPLLNRCTNREAYSERSLPKATYENIVAACQYPDIKSHILLGSKKEQCAEILNNLENIRLNNLLLIREVLPYLRTDEKEIHASRDLLDIRTLNLSAGSQKLIKFAKKFPRVHGICFLIVRLLGLLPKDKFRKSLLQSAALIALSVGDRSQYNYVHLGRTLQRILNNLTAENIQSYTIVSGLYLLDLLKENLEIYSKQEQLLLLRYQYDLQNLFSFTDRRVALFIRVGYADPPKFRSLRKNVDDMMLDSTGNSASPK